MMTVLLQMSCQIIPFAEATRTNLAFIRLVSGVHTITKALILSLSINELKTYL